MAHRQIILDTETTGISAEEGHRIIEIGCIEMIDRKITGNHYHQYINPEREVEAGALAVHGISNEFLNDKPVFTTIVEDFMNFVKGAEVIIHNAPFDVSFINHELSLTRQGWKTFSNYCKIVDTLSLARRMHAGQRNSLDALCKRYKIDNTKRDLHGALLDADLLAQVYLAMTGGQSSLFDLGANPQTSNKRADEVQEIPIQKHQLTLVVANEVELCEHNKYLEMIDKAGKCVWNIDNLSQPIDK